MRVPTIHLNGTSQEALLEQLKYAYQSVAAELEAIAIAIQRS